MFDGLFLVCVHFLLCYGVDMALQEASPAFQALYGIDLRYYNYLKPEFLATRFECCNTITLLLTGALFLFYPITKFLVFFFFLFYLDVASFTNILFRIWLMRLLLNIDLDMQIRDWAAENLWNIMNLIFFMTNNKPLINLFMLIENLHELEQFVDHILVIYKRVLNGEVNAIILNIKIILHVNRDNIEKIQAITLTVLALLNLFFGKVDTYMDLGFVYYSLAVAVLHYNKYK